MKKKKLTSAFMFLGSLVLFYLAFFTPLKKIEDDTAKLKIAVPNLIPTWISHNFSTKKNPPLDPNAGINKISLKIETSQAPSPILDYLFTNFKFQSIDNISPDKKNLIAGGHLMYDVHVDRDLDIAFGAGAMVSSIKNPGDFSNSINIHPSIGASLGYSF